VVNWLDELSRLGRGSTLLVVAVGLMVVVVLAPWLAARLQANRLLVVLALVAMIVILATTVPVRGRSGLRRLGDTVSLDAVFTWWRAGWGDVPQALRDSEGLLNVALFVPAGFLWTLLTGRPPRVLVALLGLSFMVETLQALSGQRVPQTSDLVANTLGALIGVAVAMAATAIGRARRPAVS